MATSGRTEGETPFHLAKWYLDCVTERGDAWIGYAVELRWHGFNVRHASTLLAREGVAVREQRTSRPEAFPEPADDGLRWACPALGVSGSWRRMDPPLHVELFASDEGFVRWHCLLPRARAEVRLQGAWDVSGLGYAEHLILTIPPWKLPLDELHWGRFLSEQTGLAWIDWRGARPQRLVARDGVRLPGAWLSGGGMVLDRGRVELVLSERRTLREAAFSHGALAGLPWWLRPFVPRRLLRAFERKWRSRGTLVAGGVAVAEGWAIHEVVGFADEGAPATGSDP